MRYSYMDFFPWEKQIIINQLKKEGKHVYSVVDTGGVHFSVGYGIINRYAWMVTDEPLPLGDRPSMMDVEFYDLHPVEDDSIKVTTIDLSEDIKKAKDEYDSREEERNEQWHRIMKDRDIIMNLERKYSLFKIGSKQKRPKYDNGKILVLQCIDVSKLPENDMRIMYFLKDGNTGCSLTQSRSVIVPRGCSQNKWLSIIEDKEHLCRRILVKDQLF